MTIHHEVRTSAEHQELLHRLVEAQGLGRHAFFLVSGEGRITPDGFEETSGYVLNEDGRAFFFWTGWNPSRAQVGFEAWQPTEIQPDWAEDDEYRAAVAQVGPA